MLISEKEQYASGLRLQSKNIFLNITDDILRTINNPKAQIGEENQIKILGMLIEDAEIKNSEIARKLGLTKNTISNQERKRLPDAMSSSLYV